jgi:hypothetical protein
MPFWQPPVPFPLLFCPVLRQAKLNREILNDTFFNVRSMLPMSYQA